MPDDQSPSQSSIEVEVSKLRAIADILFKKLDEFGVEAVSLTMSDTFYWEVLSSELWEMAKEPDELVVGSVLDEWEFLSDILEDDEFYVDECFLWFAAMMRFIGDRIRPSDLDVKGD